MGEMEVAAGALYLTCGEPSLRAPGCPRSGAAAAGADRAQAGSAGRGRAGRRDPALGPGGARDPVPGPQGGAPDRARRLGAAQRRATVHAGRARVPREPGGDRGDPDRGRLDRRRAAAREPRPLGEGLPAPEPVRHRPRARGDARRGRDRAPDRHHADGPLPRGARGALSPAAARPRAGPRARSAAGQPAGAAGGGAGVAAAGAGRTAPRRRPAAGQPARGDCWRQTSRSWFRW